MASGGQTAVQRPQRTQVSWSMTIKARPPPSRAGEAIRTATRNHRPEPDASRHGRQGLGVEGPTKGREPREGTFHAYRG